MKNYHYLLIGINYMLSCKAIPDPYRIGCFLWRSSSVASLAAIAVIAILASSCTSMANSLRIMPLGDSITAGYTDNPTWNVPFEFGYRSGLYTRLTNAGYDFQFVGSSLEPFNNAFGDPTRGGTVSPTLDLRSLGQDGHNGFGGASIGFIQDRIGGWLADDDPDIILLMIGINGISVNSPSQLDTLVNTIVTAQPDAHLIVSQITPRLNYNQDLFDFNTYIRNTLVPTYAGLGHNVTTVDLYANFLTDPQDETSIDPALFSNGINHPSNPAYDLIAQTWFEGIGQVVPEPSTFSLLSCVAVLTFINRPRRLSVALNHRCR